MKTNNKWVETAINLSSYLIVAAAAVFVTLTVCRSRTGKLAQLEEIVDRMFIDDYDRTEVQDTAASALVQALGDRWSYYIPAAQYGEIQERKNNAYVGVGITISANQDHQGFPVIGVTAGGPAESAGVLPGDLVTMADGQNVLDMTQDQLRDIIRGKAGESIKVTVMRDGETKEFSMVRAKISTPVAWGKMLPGQQGLITIVNFNSGCSEAVIEQIETLLNEGAQSLIFDVRNNGGGFVDEMVKILDHLLPEGKIFQSIDYNGEETVNMSDSSCVDVPIAVMVNGSTYSAAEYFAAVLREFDRGIVVGENTTGKGHFQYTLPLKDGSAVNLSVGRYETPNGINLEEEGGLTPDVTVPVDDDTGAQIFARTLKPEQDPQIQAAVKALNPEKSK